MKPREFWITREFERKGVWSLKAHEKKPSWDSIQLGDERIRVIEKSAYSVAQADLKVAQDQVENLKMVCRRLVAAKTLETRDRIAKQCHHLFEGSITRNVHARLTKSLTERAVEILTELSEMPADELKKILDEHKETGIGRAIMYGINPPEFPESSTYSEIPNNSSCPEFPDDWLDILSKIYNLALKFDASDIVNFIDDIRDARSSQHHGSPANE